MSISHRILVLILVPIAAVLGLSGLMVTQRVSTLMAMNQLTKGGEIIRSLDLLVDAVQTERGRTAVFLGSSGAMGSEELAAQRRATDDRVKSYLSSIDEASLVSFSDDTITAVRASTAGLSTLSRLRDTVASKAIHVVEATRSYSELVDRLLAVSLAIVHDTGQPGIKNNALALNFLQAAKERAGRGRAAGASALAGEALTEEQLYSVVAMAAEEDEFTKLFALYAPRSTREDLEAKMRTNEAQDVDRLRRSILAAPIGQKVAGVDAAQWFAAATARVRLLGDLQNQLLTEVLAQVSQARAGAIGELETTSLLVAALIAGLAAMGFFVMRSISRPIIEVARSMAALACESLGREAETKAQMGLDANLTALREMLYSHGKPRCEDGKLYFGDYLANGSDEIVDAVQSRYGGAATIFLGDVRIATNVLKPDGSRAVGTPLARGPAWDEVITNRRMYKGEARIFEQTYAALYEPILDGTDILGILFVGVVKPPVVATADGGAGRSRNEVEQMRAMLAILETATRAKDQTERAALEQRYLATDRARQATAASQAVAAEQKLVVAALAAALASLANTDLSHDIETRFPQQFRDLETNYSAATQILRETLRTIRAQASTLSSVTGDISRAADDLSKRTEQQAASLEETAAALDQITANVKHTADGAGHGREVVAKTRADAERSGEVVRRAVAAMGGIKQSSLQIGQIIGVIDEIAFQTNLLALNAGVEAARAGEAGRGFAVVASEVRALAQRSAGAAKEIKVLISTSTRQVDEGVNLVDETGSALERILGQVAEISSIISDIATATQEQATGLAQINTSVNQMDQFTQQNAAMVEQTAAAGHSLEQENEELTRLIGRFRIDADTEAARPSVPRRAASGPRGADDAPSRRLARSA